MPGSEESPLLVVNSTVISYIFDDSNKFFYIDPEKCILCGKCVYVCKDLQGVEALGFNKRGHDTFVSFAFDNGMEQSNCVSCGNCVSVCPTGAITGPRAEPHNLDASKCIKCRACYEICRFDAIAGNAIVISSRGEL